MWRPTVVLAIAILATAPLRAQGAATLRGDVSGDGQVTALDAQAVLSHVVGMALPAGFDAAHGDATGDGAVTALDAQVILSFAAGMPMLQFPVGLPFEGPVARVTLTPGTATVDRDQTLQLQATLVDADGAPLTRRTVTWVTSDPIVATVTAAGVVHAHAAGAATITATSEGRIGTAAVTVVVPASITTADSVRLTRHLDALAMGWVPAQVDSANLVLLQNRYGGAQWQAFFTSYFKARPLTMPLRDYLQYPLLYWFDGALHGRLQHAVGAALRAAIERTLATHGAALEQAFAADTMRRHSMVAMHLLLGQMVRAPDARDNVPSVVHRFYASLVAAYPQLFSAAVTVDRGAQPGTGTVRRHVQVNLVQAGARAGVPVAELRAQLRLEGSRATILATRGIAVLDNNGLDPARLGLVQDYLAALPPRIHNLTAVTTNDQFGLPWWWLDEPTTQRSGTVANFDGNPSIGALYNPFPRDIAPRDVPFFMLRLILETHWSVHAVAFAPGTALQRRRDAVIQASGADSLNWLRSEAPPGFMAAAPERLLLFGAELWFTSSVHTLRLGRQRFDAGRPRPLNQALLLAELYSSREATYTYEMDRQGRITRTVAPVQRDANGHISALVAGDSIYTFVRDAAGNVLSYTLRPAAGTPVHAVSLPATLEVAQTMTSELAAELRDAAGNVLAGRVVGWSSSAPSIASVDAAGRVRGELAGTATITATSEGRSASTTVTVTPLNLRIDRMYLVQAVQRPDGSVPVVADRPALLRIFAVGSQPNAALPPVRVRVFQNGVLSQTLTVPPTGLASGTPSAVDEVALGASWNVTLPASLVRPGLALLADVDPGDAMPESNEEDNLFPVGGTLLQPVVARVPDFRIRFVPVHTAATGVTGFVDDVEKHARMSMPMRMHPLARYDADVRATYTTSAPVGTGTSDQIWSAYGQVLSEIEFLRVSEGSGRYYYGTVVDALRMGFGGLAYLPGMSGVGIDGSSDREGTVIAHELGHNLGRPHAPCGNPGGPDWSYPYPNADIGAVGYDQLLGVTFPTTYKDVMSYCSPQWVSPYTWERILSHRGYITAAGALAERAAAHVPEPTLVVWGRIGRAGPVLEPAFDVVTVPSLPDSTGPYTVEGRDASGDVLFHLAFAGTRVEHLEGERHFAFAVPLDSLRRARLARIVLRADGREASLAAGDATGAAPSVRAEGAGAFRVRWDPRKAPAVLVRDVATGQVIAVARGGNARVRGSAHEVELVLSDGVRSSGRRLLVR